MSFQRAIFFFFFLFYFDIFSSLEVPDSRTSFSISAAAKAGPKAGP